MDSISLTGHARSATHCGKRADGQREEMTPLWISSCGYPIYRMCVGRGEPLLQLRFSNTPRNASGAGLHTAVDTVEVSIGMPLAVIPFYQSVSIRIKQSRRAYKRSHGVDNEAILSNIQGLANGITIWIRVPSYPASMMLRWNNCQFLEGLGPWKKWNCCLIIGMVSANTRCWG